MDLQEIQVNYNLHPTESDKKSWIRRHPVIFQFLITTGIFGEFILVAFSAKEKDYSFIGGLVIGLIFSLAGIYPQYRAQQRAMAKAAAFVGPVIPPRLSRAALVLFLINFVVLFITVLGLVYLLRKDGPGIPLIIVVLYLQYMFLMLIACLLTIIKIQQSHGRLRGVHYALISLIGSMTLAMFVLLTYKSSGN